MKAKMPAVVALLALFAGAFQSHASIKVRCDVLTIEASNSNRGIDPALKSYAAVFKQPPFAGFNTFQLIHRKTYDMPLNVPVTLTLPASLGGSLRLTRKDGSQLDLTLALARQGRKPIEINGRASPGTPFFAAGLKNQKGVWIIGVACNRDEIVVH
ncbi:MAG: hypothetical protein GY847_13720 [Proteobacteria bacterium]|nr:hypothetical protein [Pseudomonadota bacterium]